MDFGLLLLVLLSIRQSFVEICWNSNGENDCEDTEICLLFGGKRYSNNLS